MLLYHGELLSVMCQDLVTASSNLLFSLSRSEKHVESKKYFDPSLLVFDVSESVRWFLLDSLRALRSVNIKPF